MDPVTIVFALVAAVIFLRLYSILGRRTGHEQSLRDRFSKPKAGGKSGKAKAKKTGDNVVALPGAKPQPQSAARDRAEASLPGLAEIRAQDPDFSLDLFLSGAKAAHEMIVTAFAAGDRETLRRLVSAEVFASFDRVISKRAARDEMATAQLVSIGEAKAVDAKVAGSRARITVDLTSEQVRYVKDAQGAVVEGDPSRVSAVTDRWTFERDLASPDPNWTLVATGAAR